MNKLFTKAAKILVGLSLAAGVGVAVGSQTARRAYAAENDTHDFEQSLSQLLNNSASISPISIAQQSYSVKEVEISYRYNKTLSNPVTIAVTVGSTVFTTEDSPHVVGTGSNYSTVSFTGDATVGAVSISFTNNGKYGNFLLIGPMASLSMR